MRKVTIVLETDEVFQGEDDENGSGIVDMVRAAFDPHDPTAEVLIVKETPQQ